MPWHSMPTYACVHVVRQICLKIPSNLLHVELTRTQVDKYDFSNRYGQPLHVDVLQIWITVIKWLENHLNVFKSSNDRWNFPNCHSIVVVLHVKRRIKFEGRKRTLSRVRHQTCMVPSRNHEPSSELLRFVRGVCPNFRQTCQFCDHIICWHDITSTKVSCVADIFLIFWN